LPSEINNQNELLALKTAVENCDNSETAPIVIFISKMVTIPKEHINERGLSILFLNKISFSKFNKKR